MMSANTMDENYPMVYIVIPVWNNINMTLACLESLEQQDYPRYCVVVVDNGSTDGTSERVRSAFAAVVVLCQDVNLGFTGACNIGIQWALEHGADYVFLLNNDTVIDPKALQNLVTASEARTNVGAASPVIYFFSEPTAIWYAGGMINLKSGVTCHRTHAADIPQDIYSTQWANGCAVLVPRKVFKTVGLLDPVFFASYEDVDFSLRLREAGLDVIVVPQAKVWHKVSLTWGHQGQFYYYTTRNRLYLLRKLGGSWWYVYWSFRLGVGAWIYTLWNFVLRRQDRAIARLFELAGVGGFLLRQRGKAPSWVYKYGSKRQIFE